MGVVYLIQYKELLSVNVIKIESSRNERLKYIMDKCTKGAVIISIEYTNEPFELEKRLIRVFDRKFKRFEDKKSYYEYKENVKKLRKIFDDCINNNEITYNYEDEDDDIENKYVIDNLAEFQRISNIEDIHLHNKSKELGRIKFIDQDEWFPINEDETLLGWLIQKSWNDGYYYDGELYTYIEFRDIYRNMPKSDDDDISNYCVEFDINYDKLINEIKSIKYPEPTRVLMVGGQMRR